MKNTSIIFSICPIILEISYNLYEFNLRINYFLFENALEKLHFIRGKTQKYMLNYGKNKNRILNV